VFSVCVYVCMFGICVCLVCVYIWCVYIWCVYMFGMCVYIWCVYVFGMCVYVCVCLVCVCMYLVCVYIYIYTHIYIYIFGICVWYVCMYLVCVLKDPKVTGVSHYSQQEVLFNQSTIKQEYCSIQYSGDCMVLPVLVFGLIMHGGRKNTACSLLFLFLFL